MDSVLNRQDRDLLAGIVAKAGELAKTHYDLNSAEIRVKSNNSPVTDADIAVNTFLQTELMKARPDYGWLSEETKDDGSRRKKKRVFVVDPIDGTRAFIKRRPHFVVSVAIIENGRSVAGALFNPLSEEAFNAHLGGGATLNGQTISVSNCTEIEDCRMIGYDFKFKAQKIWPEMTYEARNSMAYRIALVASGQADATIAFTPKCDWDLAAASLIAGEAGALITDRDGKPFEFDKDGIVKSGVICASPRLHPLLLETVRKIPRKVTPPSPRN